jgi:hypothetical protein
MDRRRRLTATFRVALLLTLIALGRSAVAAGAELPKALLPDDTNFFVFLRWSEMLKHPAFGKLRPLLPGKSDDLNAAVDQNSQITWRDFESVLIAYDPAEKEFVVICPLSLEVDETVFVNPNEPKESVGEQVVHLRSNDRAECLVGGKTLINGKLTSVRNILKRKGDAKIAESVDAAWRGLDRSQQVAVVVTGEMLRRGLSPTLPERSKLRGLLEKVDVLAATVGFNDPLELSFRAECDQETSAAQWKQTLDAVFKGLKSKAESPAWVEVCDSYQSSTQKKSLTTTLKIGIDILVPVVANFPRPAP